MRLFWKSYLLTIVCFFVATVLFSLAVYLRQAEQAQHVVTEEITAGGRFITGELEARGARSEWPFESLMALTQANDDIMFWWAVRADGTIHLANQADFMGTDARPLYPSMIIGEGEKTIIFSDEHYGVYSKSFLINDETWHFVMGFSLKGVIETKREIVLWLSAYFCGALLLLGWLSWLLMKRLTGPIRELLVGVERIGSGDLTRRVVADSNDEIGDLANAFNTMSGRLKDVYDNLEAKVVQRTQELEAHRLEFISVATHQLKTPITSIKWGMEELQERASSMDAESKELVVGMHKAASGMAELVNALLNVSRLELGTYAVIQEPVSLADELKSVLKLLEKEIGRKRLKIALDVGVALPDVYEGDRQLIIIIFQNLISNAVKYSHEDGEIFITLDKRDDVVIFEVKDFGIGIPREQQAKLFTKLFRADNAQKIEGTGLGLFITKTIVESVNGNIEFISSQGRGTTFTVTLPGNGMPARAGTRRLT